VCAGSERSRRALLRSNWVLEGSNDGVKWVILREHSNDWALDKKGATFTWPVNSGNNSAAAPAVMV
jgi:hypothetical protein